MNYIRKMLLALVVVLGITSCEDAYDIEPAGILDDATTFQTVGDLNTYLNGFYTSAGITNEIAFTAIFTDELAPAPNYNGSNRGLHRFVLNADNGYASSIWRSNYRAINRANRLLKGAELITPTEAEQAQYNDALAQARFLRANAYLKLLSYFSTDMTNGEALGVIVFEGVPDLFGTYPRSSNAECFEVIKQDLEYAKDNLLGTNDYVHANKAAAEALLARMYAYKGDYTNAKIYAQNVIDNYGLSLTSGAPLSGSDFYSSTPTNQYRSIWADASRGEQIFTLKSEVTDTGFSPATTFYFNSTDADGSPIWMMGYNQFLSLLDMNDDVRSYAFTDPSSTYSERLVYIDKYPGIDNASLRNSLKLIRLTEMYYILAEAATASSDLQAAANYILEVQQARTYDAAPSAPSFSSATEAWAGILAERRREYCYEAHRYVDLRRLGAKANVSIDRSDFDDELQGMPLTIDITDHRFTLPIPLDEIAANPIIEQNPGY